MMKTPERQRMLVDAFNHLQCAIELLDRAAAPGNIAANLDLALHHLQGELTLEQENEPSPLDASDAGCEAVWTFSRRPAH